MKKCLGRSSLSVLLAVILLVGLIPLSTLTAFATTSYDLWVGGVQVTSDNAPDVFGDGTVSFNAPTNTLTLNGFSYSGTGWEFDFGDSSKISNGGIVSFLSDLTLVLQGENTINLATQFPGGYTLNTYGVYSNKELVLEGTGSLTVRQSGDSPTESHGIFSDGDVTVNGGTLDLSTHVMCTHTNGIYIRGSLTVNGGKINATGQQSTKNGRGICLSGGTLTVNGGMINAQGYGTNYGDGIYYGYAAVLNGGAVTAVGSGVKHSYGLNGSDSGDLSITIDKNIASLNAVGDTAAFDGTVTNAVSGTGWTDRDGTEGEAAIAVNTSGAVLEYKKVSFKGNSHVFTYFPQVDADCTTAGKQAYYHCEDCDKYFEDAAALVEITDLSTWGIIAPSHKYGSVVTSPDCTNGGYTTYTCSVCGDSYVSDYTSALGHDYSAEVVDEQYLKTAGNCASDAVYYKSCSRCGLASTTETFTAGSASKVTVGDLANASTDSYLPMNSLYNYSYSQQIYTAAEIGVACTITSVTLWMYGNANLYTIPMDIYMLETEKDSFSSGSDWIPVTAADKVYSGSVTVHNTDAEAFTFTLDTPFAYSGNGNLVLCFDNNTGSWKSGLNGKVFGSNTDPVRAIYVRNDSANYNPPAMSGITANATTYRRNVVEFGILSAASACPHTLSPVAQVDPGCEIPGKVAYYHCSVCGKDFEDADGETEITDIDTWGITAPLGHDYSAEVVDAKYLKSAADCENPAVYYKSCSRCGAASNTLTFVNGSALGHDWGAWKVTTPAGETTPGEETRVCSRDATHTETQPIDPTGHTLTLVSAKDPTATTPGNKAYYTCSGCDKIFEDAAGTKEITDKDSVVIPATGTPASVAYKIADSENYTKESDKSLTFTSDADFSKFVSVKVDGKEIDKANYTAVSGSTKITLKPAYLDTLSVGTHTLTIVSSDGEATTQFRILAASAPAPARDDTPVPAADPAPARTPTGDHSHIGIYVLAMLIGLAGICGVVFVDRRKRRG